MLNVVCVKWGNWCHPYGADYVNALAESIRRHLTLPHRFLCFTDDASGLDPCIETQPLPQNLTGSWWETVYPHRKARKLRSILSLPYLLKRRADHRALISDDKYKTRYPIDLRGYYNKLYLFKSGVLTDQTLFVDLDTLIVGNIDEIATYDGSFCILRDFHQNLHYGSGLMLFDPATAHHVWDTYVAEGCPMFKMGDQAFIEKMMPDADFFQDRLPGQVVSYKVHCRKAGIPSYARIVCFHGSPRPHEVGYIVKGAA